LGVSYGISATNVQGAAGPFDVVLFLSIRELAVILDKVL
jgi:hypothetical protein